MAEKKLSYEEARDQLTQIVAQLEGGGSSLEESLALWERGQALSKICQEWLDGAKAKLDAARPASAEVNFAALNKTLAPSSIWHQASLACYPWKS